MWWSANGQALAFLSFNNTQVRKYPIEHYERDERYPRLQLVPYPKVDQVIPTVNFYVWNKTRNVIIELKPPKDVSDLR